VARLDDRTLVAIEDAFNSADQSSQTVVWGSRDGRTWVQIATDRLVRQGDVVEAHSGGLVKWARDAGGYDLFMVTDDLRLVPLEPDSIESPSGDLPQYAIGPAGVLATDDGTTMWLGTR